MKSPNSPPDYTRKKKIFKIIFLSLDIIIFGGIWTLYDLTSQHSENEQATVTFGILLIVLFILFLVSFFMSANLTYYVRRRLISCDPGSPLDRLVCFWLHMVPPFTVECASKEIVEPEMEEETEEDSLSGLSLSDSELDEMLEFMLKHKGRGKKSDIPDEIRFHTVRDWVSMQMKGTSVKLQDFLDERFDTSENGMPNVPRNTYYGWQRQFKKIAVEYLEAKKTMRTKYGKSNEENIV
jgi:hypothetical protein